MSKVITFFMLLGMVPLLSAQPAEERYYPDFFGQDHYFEPDTSSNYEIIKWEEQVVAFRRFFDQRKIVAEEYIHLGKDSFLYLAYSLPHHELIAKGKLVPGQGYAHIDSLYDLDQESFEEIVVLEKYQNWSKEGPWLQREAAVEERGHYQNNKRVGEWRSFDFEQGRGKYRYYDVNGNLRYEEPQNLLETKDYSRIAEELVGTWVMQEPLDVHLDLAKVAGGTPRPDKSQMIISRDQLSFQLRPRCSNSFIRTPSANQLNTWHLDENNVLRVYRDGAEYLTFKITYLGRHEMQLTLIQ